MDVVEDSLEGVDAISISSDVSDEHFGESEPSNISILSIDEDIVSDHSDHSESSDLSDLSESSEQPQHFENEKSSNTQSDSSDSIDELGTFIHEKLYGNEQRSKTVIENHSILEMDSISDSDSFISIRMSPILICRFSSRRNQ